MPRPKSEKGEYVKLSGVRVPPEDWEAMNGYYPSYGMRNKVVRVLIKRHLAKLQRLTDAQLSSELVNDLELIGAATDE